MTTASRTRCRWPTSIRRPASSPRPTRARPERRRTGDRHDGVADAIVPGSGARGRGRGLLPRVGAERDLDRLAAGRWRPGVPVRLLRVRLLLPALARLAGQVAGVGVRPPVTVDGYHDHAARGAQRGHALLRAAADQGR